MNKYLQAKYKKYFVFVLTISLVSPGMQTLFAQVSEVKSNRVVTADTDVDTDAGTDVATDVGTDAGTDVDSRSGDLPLQMALVTSGGVSLGAYQAGYLYYLSELTMLNPQILKPRIITGSSAGSINAVISAIVLGRNSQQNPSSSLFYKIWMGLNIGAILDVKNAPPLALSSRKAMDKLMKLMERASGTEGWGLTLILRWELRLPGYRVVKSMLAAILRCHVKRRNLPFELRVMERVNLPVLLIILIVPMESPSLCYLFTMV